MWTTALMSGKQAWITGLGGLQKRWTNGCGKGQEVWTTGFGGWQESVGKRRLRSSSNTAFTPPSRKSRKEDHPFFCSAWFHYFLFGAPLYTCIYMYPPTPAGAAPRSSVHVCSPLSTTRPLPFLQIAIGPRLPHPFYCSGISPPPPGTRRSHSAVLGTTSRPRLLDPFHLSTTRHSSALLGTLRHHKPSILVVLQW